MNVPEHQSMFFADVVINPDQLLAPVGGLRHGSDVAAPSCRRWNQRQKGLDVGVVRVERNLVIRIGIEQSAARGGSWTIREVISCRVVIALKLRARRRTQVAEVP